MKTVTDSSKKDVPSDRRLSDVSDNILLKLWPDVEQSHMVSLQQVKHKSKDGSYKSILKKPIQQDKPARIVQVRLYMSLVF